MKTDVVIVGGGPGGASCAMFLAQQGIRPIIIEKERFPRYHIGESMTGECGGVLRELGLGEEMLKRQHPVKQGVKVFGQSKRGSWFLPVMMRTEDYQLRDQFTWQVRRSEFDKMMLDEAITRGATLIPGQATKPLMNKDGSVGGVEVRTADGGLLEITSEVLLDCSGQNTFLAHAGVTGPKYLGNYDRQIAIFSQVAGAIRDNGTTRDMHKDNALIFYQKKFHWAWSIPLDDDVVSVGIVVPAAYFLEKKESTKDFLMREMRELHPELSRRIPELKLVEDVHVIPNYSYQVRRFCGKGFICVGDAHRFIDPIFSFGLYVTIKESQFAAPAIKSYLEGKHRDAANPFSEYQLHCEKGIDVLEDVLDTFWEHPMTFALFVYTRFKEYMIDAFAGRIYDHQPSPAVTEFRKFLNRERERDYVGPDLYSMPIGSRYHPERAPLWEANSDVACTEEWMER